jgi:hypothetical protein
MSDESELSKLKKEVAELKDQLNPPPRQPSTHPRFDPTEGMSMPRSAMQAMVDAVPDALMRDLRADARKPNPATLSGGVTKPTPTEPPKVIGKKGWIDERPIEPPPGIEHCDRMMDEQDRVDRAELAMRLAKAELAKGEE